MPKADRFYFLTGVLLVVILSGFILFARQFRPEARTAEADSPKAKGPVAAPVQLMEFSDFQCPACRVAQETLSELIRLYPEKIRLIFRHFPLEGHRWSSLAHQAAECAAEQGKFWAYHDRLYAEQTVWSLSETSPLEIFLRYAKETGLDLDRYTVCLSSAGVNQRLREEKAAGSGLGVRSTPSFFVNGKMVMGAPALRQEVEKALE